jgi:4'-phosphopantetheinyl transferase
MKLTPKPWSWSAPQPGSRWLQDGPPDVPVVWLAGLAPDAAVQSHLAALLSPEEQARLQRLQLADDRQRFLAARGLLRILVGAHLNVPPERVEFDYGPFGKPCVASPNAASGLHFNVSHSGDLVVLAFHRLQEVGVDIERVQPQGDWETIAAQIFPTAEYRDWSRLNPEARLTAFFRAWTRLEADLKALGRGIAAAGETSPDPSLARFDLILPEGYQGAVCLCP